MSSVQIVVETLKQACMGIQFIVNLERNVMLA